MSLGNLIAKHLSGKKVLLFFVLTNLVYAFMLLVTIPKVMTYSEGLPLLDMMPTGYRPEYVVQLFETLGEEGRSAYLYNQLPADMIYPLLFAISYCLLLAYFLEKLSKLDTQWIYLCWLPLVAGAADYAENFGIISMLNSFPDVSSGRAALTNYFTVIKSVSTTGYFVALTLVLLVLGFRGKRNS
ncbi:MAG TPA: hypothetical protein DIW27_06545 [Cytophagales bacterium]|nr:hypothetical protein [Cytophagales bacterium]